MTRLNVYAGPAGSHLIRGEPRGRQGGFATVGRERGAVLPGPAPKEGDRFPSNKTYFEIRSVQDRAFNSDGSLFYPDSRKFFDEATAEDRASSRTPTCPDLEPEFFGNMIMVNGNTWPFLDVQRRRYRLRFLNGCQSRFLIAGLRRHPGVEVWQIGNEGGFLAAPVSLTADRQNRLLMGLAERADLIVDFTNVPQGRHPRQRRSGRAVRSGEPGSNPDGFDIADPDSTGRIVAFDVGPAPDPTTPPRFLVLPALKPLPRRRGSPLALIENDVEFWDGPAEAMLGQVDGDGNPVHKMWADPVSENPSVGDTETWEFFNFTADAHPMHVHEVAFEVVDRRALVANEDGETVRRLDSSAIPGREAWESGFKDTVIAYPGEVTRIRAKFDTPGQFVWRCHIVEHEDNEMMRPYRIGPVQPGQPGLDLRDLVEPELDRRLAVEDVDEHLELALVDVDLADRAVEVRERPGDDPHHVPLLEAEAERGLHLLLLHGEDLLDLAAGQRGRLRAGPGRHEPGHARRVADDVQVVVVVIFTRR